MRPSQSAHFKYKDVDLLPYSRLMRPWGAKRLGVRLGKWLSAEQGKERFQGPCSDTLGQQARSSRSVKSPAGAQIDVEIDPDYKALLFQCEDDRRKWWATPGAGLEVEPEKLAMNSRSAAACVLLSCLRDHIEFEM